MGGQGLGFRIGRDQTTATCIACGIVILIGPSSLICGTISVLWPQDTIYLVLLMILGALTLFLFTAVAGRIWCGYTCPQTVYTEIFLWVEKTIEGERPQRIKLDAA